MKLLKILKERNTDMFLNLKKKIKTPNLHFDNYDIKV